MIWMSVKSLSSYEPCKGTQKSLPHHHFPKIYCRLIVRSSRGTVVFQRWKANFPPLGKPLENPWKLTFPRLESFWKHLEAEPSGAPVADQIVAICTTLEEIWIVYAGNGESPRRNGKILRNFDFFLPKFHFILPKFYIPSPWKTKDLHRSVADFLRGD